MRTYFYCSQGNYNFADPSEKQWCLELSTPFGRVSETFNEKPDLDDLLPTDVLDLIEERVKSYWIYTSREECLKRIDGIRAHSLEINRQFIEFEIKKHQTAISELESKLDDISDLEASALGGDHG
jgi:hypothetical protein